MTGADAHENGTDKSSQANFTNPQLTMMGIKGVDGLIAMQSELLKEFQEASRSWFDRMGAETALASELTAKMSSAHSLPEAANVFQEWSGRRMKMATEDAGHLLSDAQRFMTVGVRMLSNGWAANGSSTPHAG